VTQSKLNPHQKPAETGQAFRHTGAMRFFGEGFADEGFQFSSGGNLTAILGIVWTEIKHAWNSKTIWRQKGESSAMKICTIIASP
jgi:hypothetical protein